MNNGPKEGLNTWKHQRTLNQIRLKKLDNTGQRVETALYNALNLNSLETSFLRHLRSFNICWMMLWMLNESVVASFCLLCPHYTHCTGAAQWVTVSISWSTGKIVGVELDSLTVGLERKMLFKLGAALDNHSRPLHIVPDGHRSQSSARLIQPRCAMERHGKSFLPQVIRLYKSSFRHPDYFQYLAYTLHGVLTLKCWILI